MAAELVGIPLVRFEDPIRVGLNRYQEIVDNGLVFDADTACQLVLTPEKSNSARSESSALLGGQVVGTLFVIAFKPGDGTGSEVSYRLSDLAVAYPYPRKSRVVPRDKTGVHNEGHFAIATHALDDLHAEPKLYAGNYDLLGIKRNRVARIGQLGQTETREVYEPVVTMTVGYDLEGKRFGDPHAVYSWIPDSLQVCAFLAFSDAVENTHPGLLLAWNPQYPD